MLWSSALDLKALLKRAGYWDKAPEPTPFWQSVATTPAIITSRAIKERYVDAIAAVMGQRNDDLERDLVYAPGWRSALAWLEQRELQRASEQAAREEWPWPLRK